MTRTLIAGVLLCAVAAPVGGTTLIATDLPEMSREARAIALGRVAAVQARLTGDRRGIETLVTVDTESYLKGELGPEVQFVVPGGSLGRLRQVVLGAPRLAVGQRILVFLGARPPGLPYILGFNQGLFHVALENGQPVVAMPRTGTTSGPAASAMRGGSSGRRMRLDDFVRQVRTLSGLQQ